MGPAASCMKAPAVAETSKSTKSASSAISKAASAMEKKLVEATGAVEKTIPAAVASIASAVAGITKGDAKKFSIGAAVSTPYGIGVLAALRADNFAVVQLDFGAKAYILPHELAAAPVPKVGEKCSTVYGDGKVSEIRSSDGFVVVALNFGAKAFLRSDQVRPQRAYPFVPASHWTSGIYARPTSVTPQTEIPKAEKKNGKGSASPAKGSKSPVKAPEPAPVKLEEAEPAPAHPAEEKDASEVPPPAQQDPPAAAEEAAKEAPATTGSSASAKKKKKKGKN